MILIFVACLLAYLVLITMIGPQNRCIDFERGELLEDRDIYDGG